MLNSQFSKEQQKESSILTSKLYSSFKFVIGATGLIKWTLVVGLRTYRGKISRKKGLSDIITWLAAGGVCDFSPKLLIWTTWFRRFPGVRVASSMFKALHKTSISNFRFNLRSCSWCSSDSKFMMPIVHGDGGLKTLLLAQDSRTLATKGTTYMSSCWPIWWASMINGLMSKSTWKMVTNLVKLLKEKDFSMMIMNVFLKAITFLKWN